jgi:hypothetical protein
LIARVLRAAHFKNVGRESHTLRKGTHTLHHRCSDGIGVCRRGPEDLQRALLKFRLVPPPSKPQAVAIKARLSMCDCHSTSREHLEISTQELIDGGLFAISFVLALHPPPLDSRAHFRRTVSRGDQREQITHAAAVSYWEWPRNLKKCCCKRCPSESQLLAPQLRRSWTAPEHSRGVKRKHSMSEGMFSSKMTGLHDVWEDPPQSRQGALLVG